MGACKASEGLLQKAGSSETIFREALENGFVIFLPEWKVIIIHVPLEHTLTYFYLSNLVGVQSDGNVLNALPILTHSILH